MVIPCIQKTCRSTDRRKFHLDKHNFFYAIKFVEHFNNFVDKHRFIAGSSRRHFRRGSGLRGAFWLRLWRVGCGAPNHCWLGALSSKPGIWIWCKASLHQVLQDPRAYNGFMGELDADVYKSEFVHHVFWLVEAFPSLCCGSGVCHLHSIFSLLALLLQKIPPFYLPWWLWGSGTKFGLHEFEERLSFMCSHIWDSDHAVHLRGVYSLPSRAGHR